MQRCFVVEQKMIQISLLKIILSFGFMQEPKISVMNFARRAVRQAFCEPYGFVPPCSVGALVTLHHVNTVAVVQILILTFSHKDLNSSLIITELSSIVHEKL